jgi:hypothetical protein
MTANKLSQKLYERAQRFCQDVSATVETAPRNYGVKIAVMMRRSEDPVYITGSGRSLVKAVINLNATLDSMRGVQDPRKAAHKNFWRSWYGIEVSTARR